MAANASSALRRVRASKRLIVDKLTPKVAATCVRGIPRSTAATIRWRRSIEYAFINHSMPQVQHLCPLL